MAPVDPDRQLRLTAFDRLSQLRHTYDDLVPLAALREGFTYDGQRVSFGSFQNGIFRSAAMTGRAALSVLTAPPKAGKAAPYEDEIDIDEGTIVYRYRDAPVDHADNRALRAAYEEQVPLIYFLGIAPGQYNPVFPVFVTADDSAARAVILEVGVPVLDLPDPARSSTPDQRAYALREVTARLHQQRFRILVLHAYRDRCAICRLRERSLVQAAHIIEDPLPQGIAAVVNGIALCAIHHLAYDRNLLGIDPDGVVHIATRLLEERDGPMLREGLQGFHGDPITVPSRPGDRPDPERLEVRFERFQAAA